MRRNDDQFFTSLRQKPTDDSLFHGGEGVENDETVLIIMFGDDVVGAESEVVSSTEPTTLEANF